MHCCDCPYWDFRDEKFIGPKLLKREGWCYWHGKMMSAFDVCKFIPQKEAKNEINQSIR